MKKNLLINVFLSFSLIISAQTPKPQNNINISADAKKSCSIKSLAKPIGDDEFISNKYQNLRSSNTSSQNTFITSVVGTVVGTTTYDLQTNSSVNRNIINHGDSTLSTVWTFSSQNTPYTNRGSGYNYFNGSIWNSNPTIRLETIRTGWPTIGLLGNGKEFLMSHDASQYDFEQGTNTIKGSSTWTFSQSDGGGNRPGVNTIWGRIAIGGPGDSTIHLLSNYAADSVIISGVAAPFVYSRSLNTGATWDSNGVTLPGYDNTRTLRGSADDYAIDAAGNNVAIVLGGLGDDVFLWKSTNNGNSFTKIYVDSFPYAPDYATLAPLDSVIPTNDGSVTVVFDNNNKTHVAYAYSEVINSSASGASFFPGSIGLIYWNDYTNKSTSVPILLKDIDVNGNSIFDIGANTTIATGGAARYGNNSLLHKPSIAVDNNGFIYIVFSLPQDADMTVGGATLIDQNFRDIWVITSTDTGKTWGPAFNLTNTKGVEEAFASVAKLVDTKLHIVFQEDNEPGTTLTNEDPQSSNTIKYLAVTVTDVVIKSDFTFSNICTKVNFNSSVLFGSPTTQYWDFGDTTTNADTSSLQNPIYVYSDTGTYLVSYTAINLNGYYTTVSKMVVVDSKGLTVNAGIDQSVLCGQTASLLASASGGDGNYTYNWSNGITTAANTGLSAGIYFVTVKDGSGCNGNDNVTINLTGTTLALSISNDTTVCLGTLANIIANVSGGVLPYTYLWNTVETVSSISVSSGTYTVKVTDSFGCILNDIVTVTENPLLIVNTGNDTAICAGTNVNIVANASGGSGVYSYLWSNGSSSDQILVAVGTYIVTVFDQIGCVASDTINISSDSLYTLNNNNDTTICFGTTVTLSLTAGGGAGSYTYSWSTGVTTPNITVPKGTYIVTITDSIKCTLKDTITVNENLQLTVNAGVDTTGCSAAPITIVPIISGGDSNYSYLWSTGDTTATVSVNTTGNYIVTIIDGVNCTSSDTITVTVENVTASFTQSANTIDLFFTNTVDFTNLSTGALEWYWSFGNGYSSSTKNPTATYTSVGTYYVTLMINSANCADTAYGTVIVINTTSIKETEFNDNLKIYPNPSSDGMFYIKTLDKAAHQLKIIITDMNGKIVKKENINKNLVEVDLRSYAKGTYFISLQSNERTIANKMITIN